MVEKLYSWMVWGEWATWDQCIDVRRDCTAVLTHQHPDRVFGWLVPQGQAENLEGSHESS